MKKAAQEVEDEEKALREEAEEIEEREQNKGRGRGRGRGRGTPSKRPAAAAAGAMKRPCGSPSSSSIPKKAKVDSKQSTKLDPWIELVNDQEIMEPAVTRLDVHGNPWAPSKNQPRRKHLRNSKP